MLNEQDLIDVGFSKHLMLGTGWLTTTSMRDPVYWYQSPNKRIAVNASEIWTWFLDNNQRNDIGVYSKESLTELLFKYEHNKQ